MLECSIGVRFNHINKNQFRLKWLFPIELDHSVVLTKCFGLSCSLLEQIPVMFGDTRETEAILGPVIQAGLDALKVLHRHKRVPKYVNLGYLYGISFAKFS